MYFYLFTIVPVSTIIIFIIDIMHKPHRLDIGRRHMRNISVKASILTGLFLVLLATLFMVACDSPRETTTSTTGITSTSTTTSSSTLTTEAPYDANFRLSQAPKLGETAELTLEITKINQLWEPYQPRDGLAHAKAWVDFYWTNIHGSYTEALTPVKIPLKEVLVSGETSWEGNFNESRVNLRSKIQLPREGIWHIQYSFTGEGWSRNFEGNYWVAVADGTAAIMNTNTEEFKTGPLAYLDLRTFPDGGAGYRRTPISISPFSIGLDISKAPKAGEEVTLSCRVLSLIDMSDFSIQWRFYKRTGYTGQLITATELLPSTDLNWKTDIKKDEPVVFSTTIKFPTEGEWEISAIGNKNKNQTSIGDTIHITITSTKSYFGWAELPPKPYSGTTIT
jgi:hypothetical protein